VAVQVTPVRSWRDKRAFVELPFRLHASQPVWIPPLRVEQHAYLSPRLNPFFADGEAQLLLARRGGRVVGRMSAHVDHAFNRYHDRRWGLFGFLDTEDDPEVLPALFAEGERWLRARGCDRMVGPMDFTMNDGAGVLIEGFEREPFVRQTWHPPFVARRCEEAGLVKAMDLLMWELHISDRDKVLPVVWELAERCRTEHGIRIRRMSRRRLRRDLDLFGELYNDAWKDNWDFRPYSKADLDTYAQELQLVFDPNWFMVAETAAGEPAGIAITVPDINQVLKRMNGRIVKPEFQHAGVAALLYTEHFETATRAPQTWGEMGWILETNEAMNRGMEAMNGRIVKRYRMFERRFDGEAGADGG
jgi:hypothetical protein